MKKLIGLTTSAIASPAISASAGEPVSSSKEVLAPAPPPLESYFRANEFSNGLFAAYDWTDNDNVRAIGNRAWGGGIDAQYFPLRYLGFAVEGKFLTRFPLIFSDRRSPGM
jgi:hypothetical protein